MEFISQYIPDRLYISGVSALVLIIFYLPIVIYYSVKILISKNIIDMPKKISFLFLFWVVAYVIPLGDVTYYSIAMKKQCPQAGLHIYKQVHVDGFYSDILFDSAAEKLLSKNKFKFVEGKSYVDGKKEFIRYEIRKNKLVKQVVAEPKSEYEIISGDSEINQEEQVKKVIDYVRNRKTNEVIASEIIVDPIMGWIDRYFIGSLFEGKLLGCGYGGRSSLWDLSVFLPR